MFLKYDFKNIYQISIKKITTFYYQMFPLNISWIQSDTQRHLWREKWHTLVCTTLKLWKANTQNIVVWGKLPDAWKWISMSNCLTDIYCPFLNFWIFTEMRDFATMGGCVSWAKWRSDIFTGQINPTLLTVSNITGQNLSSIINQ